MAHPTFYLGDVLKRPSDHKTFIVISVSETFIVVLELSSATHIIHLHDYETLRYDHNDIELAESTLAHDVRQQLRIMNDDDGDEQQGRLDRLEFLLQRFRYQRAHDPLRPAVGNTRRA